MNYKKLHWISDFTSKEIYGDDYEEFVVGIYSSINYPELMFYINMEENEIIEIHINTLK